MLIQGGVPSCAKGSSALTAWVLVAAWLGLMLGVGAALRPSAPQRLEGASAEAQVAAWAPWLAAAPASADRLWIGDSSCGCDAPATERLEGWAADLGVEVRRVPELAGVALVDASGRLRYAGEAGALVTHCAGARGFAAWWQGPPGRPVLMQACACSSFS